MEYGRWAPVYEQIRAELGYAWELETAAATWLETALTGRAPPAPLERLRRRLSGRSVVVVGRAPRVGPPPIWRLGQRMGRWAIVAADGATGPCLEAGLVPEVIVTDLDGPVPTEIDANQRGSYVVVHAHGDNLPALREWVPAFPGELAGSWAGAPTPTLLNVGGFTDGDRAAYLAEHVGSGEIILWGFDFDLPALEEAGPRKAAKLRWAERALDHLAATSRCPIWRWKSDGSLEPYRGRSAQPEKRAASTK